jgi:hypothetical protein
MRNLVGRLRRTAPRSLLHAILTQTKTTNLASLGPDGGNATTTSFSVVYDGDDATATPVELYLDGGDSTN